MLLGAPNLSQATVNLPMAKLLNDRYDVPVRLRNDVQIAAIGEAEVRRRAGTATIFSASSSAPESAARSSRNGQLVTGASGTAGEIGHLVIDANGRLCGCGGRGHLEAYASRTAITKAILGDLQRGRPSMLTEFVSRAYPKMSRAAWRSAPACWQKRWSSGTSWPSRR